MCLQSLSRREREREEARKRRRERRSLADDAASTAAARKQGRRSSGTRTQRGGWAQQQQRRRRRRRISHSSSCVRLGSMGHGSRRHLLLTSSQDPFVPLICSHFTVAAALDATALSLASLRSFHSHSSRGEGKRVVSPFTEREAKSSSSKGRRRNAARKSPREHVPRSTSRKTVWHTRACERQLQYSVKDLSSLV